MGDIADCYIKLVSKLGGGEPATFEVPVKTGFIFSHCVLWNSIGLPAITELGQDTAADFFPRQSLRFSRIEFLDTARNLIAPSLLGGSVHVGIQALDKEASQGGAVFFRKRERFL
jgi:hypothetical protein